MKKRTHATTIWTSGDVCAEYGITRSTFGYWRRQDGFPAPITYAKNTGGTWDAALVRAWVQAFRNGDPRTRMKRVRAVSQYEAGYPIAQTARELKVDRKTIRRWLRAAGVMAPSGDQPGSERQPV